MRSELLVFPLEEGPDIITILVFFLCQKIWLAISAYLRSCLASHRLISLMAWPSASTEFSFSIVSIPTAEHQSAYSRRAASIFLLLVFIYLDSFKAWV